MCETPESPEQSEMPDAGVKTSEATTENTVEAESSGPATVNPCRLATSFTFAPEVGRRINPLAASAGNDKAHRSTVKHTRMRLIPFFLHPEKCDSGSRDRPTRSLNGVAHAVRLR